MGLIGNVSIHRIKINVPSQHIFTSVVYFIIASGVYFRLRDYSSNASLWLDEAVLALNIIHRSFSQLLTPLDYNQGAPIGFLWLTKIITTLGGYNEFFLRVIPFMTAIIAIPFFYFLVRIFFTNHYWTIIALIFFVTSDRLIYYSSEFKPYSSDVFLTILISIVGINFLRSKTLRNTLIFITIATLGILFSFPAFFTSITVLCLFYLQLIYRRERINIPTSILPVLIVGIGIALNYFIALRSVQGNSNLVRYWGNSFLPLGQPIPNILEWLGLSIKQLFADPGGVSVPIIGVGLSAIGIYNNFRKDPFVGSLPVIILIGLISASGFSLYPFSGRLLLFFVPFLIIWIVSGLELISSSIYLASKPLGYAARILSIILVTLNAVPSLIHPHVKEEIKPLIGVLQEKWQSDDGLFIYYNSTFAFDYYVDLFDIDYLVNSYKSGISSRKNPSLYRDDLDQMRSSSRFWLLFTHVYSGSGVDERLYMLDYTDSFATQIENYSAPGAYLYLYELR